MSEPELSAARGQRSRGSLGESIQRLFSSYGLSSFLLLVLFLLTLLGTLHQREFGLYAAQKRYFESMFVWASVGGMDVPVLPGGALTMGLLTLNLISGGLLRIRKNKFTAGIIVVHVGIVLMLAAGLVKFQFSHDGYLRLYEGEQSDEFVSFYKWEVAIFDADQRENVVEHLIPHDQIIDLVRGKRRTFEGAELPFELTLHTFLPNCWPARKGPMWESPGPTVDGWALKPEPWNKQAENNVAGMIAEVRDDSGLLEQTILHGFESYPWTFESGGKTWGVSFRHKRYAMPWSVRLDEFTKEDHPGMTMAKSYMSDVTVLEGAEETRLRIQMNEPLRQDGLILFQASWGPPDARPGTPLFSQFAVVRNPSDHWPLVSCIIIALGMILAFVQKLLRFMRKRGDGHASLSPKVNRDTALRSASVVLLTVAAVTAAAPEAVASVQEDAHVSSAEPVFSEEAVEAFKTLPVQAGGRVKPLDTHAGFQLLKTNGKRKVEREDGSKILRTEWLMGILFFPDQAVDLECFLVRNKDALIAADLDFPAKKRSDRFSYRELETGRRRIFEKAQAASSKEPALRSPIERQILDVATNMREFEDMLVFLDFARQTYPIGGERLKGLFGGAEEATFSEVLAKGGEITSLVRELAQDPSLSPEDDLAARQLMTQLEGYMQQAGAGLAIFPPDTDPEEEDEWITPSELVLLAFDPEPGVPIERKIQMLALLEQLHEARERPEEFAALAGDLNGGLRTLAEERGEYGHIPLEVAFYKTDYFTKSLVFFMAAFLLMAFSWLTPKRWLIQGVWVCLFVGLGMTLTGITLRCIIRERPPISTLYETILFVAATGVMTLMVVEKLTRQRVALALAPLVGAGTLFMAMKYELKEAATAGDTMPSLVAVLDTNFWLATHVTTVTLGYAAGLLAGFIAHVWILGKVFGLKRGDTKFYKSISRMTYGVLCFGLLFSIVGTILGGVWANYSWGRFWGWDPKENGALLIVLWELLILHARLGGYIRDFGLAAMSVLGAIVVAFSWWGVNLLGVGLHSYGFTDGVQRNLTIFYCVEGAIVLIGAIWWLAQRKGTGGGPGSPSLSKEGA